MKGNLLYLPSEDPQVCLREFFKCPTCPPKKGLNSTLYILRRDAAQCLGYDPNTMVQSPRKCPRVIWPGVLTIFAGIDLLAKFHANRDGRGTGKRFKEYVRKFIGCVKEDDLYLLRNALMHSFGLCIPAKSDKPEYRFSLTANRLPVLKVEHKGKKRFVRLDVISLWEAFEKAIALFHEAMLQRDLNHGRQFMKLMYRYGFVAMSPPYFRFARM